MDSVWESVSVGDVIELLTGYPFKSDLYVENGIKLLRGDNIIQGKLRWDNVKRWDKDDIAEFRRYELQSGDIVMAMDRPWVQAGLKFARIMDVDLPSLLVQRVACIRPKENLSADFLYQIISSYEFSQRLLSLQTGSTVPHISSKQIKSYKIPLPPLAEQKAIAQILGTWDEAIQVTEALIDALGRRKQGLMQRLLTGEIRFPEFIESDEMQETKFGDIPADWDYESIKNLAKSVSTKNKNDDELPVLSCTKHYGLVDSLEYFGRKIYSDNLSTYKIVERNQFAYATNHIEEGSIGYQDLYDEALISPMYTVFETVDSVNDSFLYRVLKTELYRHIFEVNTSASVNRRGSLRWNQFSLIKVPVPTVDEQKAIAHFFDELDKLIMKHEELYASLQEQKRGLMQVLLTGQVRVGG